MENSRKSPNIDSTDAVTEPLQRALRTCLQRYVGAQDRFIVALSGGVDSVVLLHALRAEIPADRIAVIHVNHGLSPNAGQWEDFCLDLCRKLDVACHVFHVEVERGSSDGLEAAARRARYRAFAEVPGEWLLLAHHQNDQAETLLFNLVRGCGVSGAAAMSERKGRVLRPFISVSRAEIQQIARTCGYLWCEDESNADVRFSRNFMRQRIIPQMCERFPAAVENLAAATGRFAEAASLLDVLAEIDLGEAARNFPVSVKLLEALGEARARNVLHYLLARNQVQIPGEKRLREALRQMLTAGIDRHPAVTLGQHRLLRRRGQLYLEPLAESN